MLKQPRLIREFTRTVDAAVTAVASRLGSTIVDEDDFTSRLLERLELALDGWTRAGITLRARKLTSRGRRAEETEFGADIVATVNIDLEEYQAEKGILAQAKRLEVGRKFGTRDWTNLEVQIEKMQRHTNDSYVWLYSPSGVRSLKSTALTGLQSRKPDDLYLAKCATFLGEFVQCKHGDPRITGCPETLSQLRDEYAARSAFSLLFREYRRS